MLLNPGLGDRLSLAEDPMPRATLELTCRGCALPVVPPAATPSPENPRALPEDDVGGGPSDWRMSFAGLEGLTGVVGVGDGDGDRWGRRV